MIVRICDVCKKNPVKDTPPEFYRPALLEKRIEHDGFVFELRTDVRLAFEVGYTPQDLCEGCAWPVLLRGCMEILGDEEKEDPNHVIIDYQNNPADWEVDAPGACGCPMDGGDREKCMGMKKVSRPAMLFTMCDCSCHGDSQ